MLSVEKVISSIEALPEKDFIKLKNWIIERSWEKWDRQIEKDSDSGKLDFLIEEAFKEKEENTLRTL